MILHNWECGQMMFLVHISQQDQAAQRKGFFPRQLQNLIFKLLLINLSTYVICIIY